LLKSRVGQKLYRGNAGKEKNRMSLDRIRLVISSCLENVRLVGLAVGRLASLALDEAECAELELCTVEAVNNAIRHAYAGEGGHEVSIIFRLCDDRIVVEVADKGTSMPDGILDRRDDALEFDPDDLDALPEGGIGLAIMFRCLDDVSYRSEPDGNVLVLTKRLRRPSIETGSY
jgi:serine/threonine-protein kinase RsbW